MDIPKSFLTGKKSKAMAAINKNLSGILIISFIICPVKDMIKLLICQATYKF